MSNRRLKQIQDRIDLIDDFLQPLQSERERLIAELNAVLAGPTTFVFLYEKRRDGPEDDLRCRVITASTVDEAAWRMARFIERRANRYEWADPGVDYEVQHGDSYIDLYALGEQHPIHPYLP